MYSFEPQIKELGPFTVTVNIAMAEGGSASYFVGLITLPRIMKKTLRSICQSFTTPFMRYLQANELMLQLDNHLIGDIFPIEFTFKDKFR